MRATTSQEETIYNSYAGTNRFRFEGIISARRGTPLHLSFHKFMQKNVKCNSEWLKICLAFDFYALGSVGMCEL